MFKNYKDDQVCSVCNKNLNDLVDGKISCTPCVNRGEEIAANRGVLVHLGHALWAFLNFEFWHTLAEFGWAIERLTGTGDFNKKTGIFYTKGYLKK